MGLKGGSKPRSRSAASRFAFEAKSEAGAGTQPGSEGGALVRNVVEIMFMIALDFDRFNPSGL